MEGVFSPGYTLLEAIGPSWLSLQYELVGSYSTDSSSQIVSLAVFNNILFATTTGPNVLIFNVSAPSSPKLLCSYLTGESSYGVAATANHPNIFKGKYLVYVYALEWSSGFNSITLMNVDVSVPCNFQIGLSWSISRYPITDFIIFDATVSGMLVVTGGAIKLAWWNTENILYDVNYLQPSPCLDISRLVIFSSSNNIMLAGCMSGELLTLSLSGSVRFSGSSSGLSVKTLSNYSSISNPITGIAISGNMAFVTVNDENRSLLTLDITDPSNLRLLSNNYLTNSVGSFTDVAVSENILFLANQTGLQILNLSQGQLIGIPPMEQNVSITITANDFTTTLASTTFNLSVVSPPTPSTPSPKSSSFTSKIGLIAGIVAGVVCCPLIGYCLYKILKEESSSEPYRERVFTSSLAEESTVQREKTSIELKVIPSYLPTNRIDNKEIPPPGQIELVSEESLSSADDSSKPQGKSESSLILEAKICIEEQRYHDAISILDEILIINSENLLCLIERGNARFCLHQYALAISNYDQALILRPNDPELLLKRGQAKMKLKQYSGAYNDLIQANSLSEEKSIQVALSEAKNEWARSYNLKAKERFAAKDYEEAIYLYDLSLGLQPNNIQAYYYRGMAKSELGNLSGAIKDFDLALSINPQQIEVLYHRAKAKSDLGNYLGALEDHHKIVSLDPGDPLKFNSRAHTRLKVGDFTGAFADFREAIALGHIQSFSEYKSAKQIQQKELENQRRQEEKWLAAKKQENQLAREREEKFRKEKTFIDLNQGLDQLELSLRLPHKDFSLLERDYNQLEPVAMAFRSSRFYLSRAKMRIFTAKECLDKSD